ncbi:MAG: ATP synthase F0 subunit B [Proteobacteria bacterium]|nr:ATP synthase F0 subunit B [Pseudomonadota bacterium]MBU1716811.1 ATP synthase F0 subunit B [Pseudomonadota bacterium]
MIKKNNWIKIGSVALAVTVAILVAASAYASGGQGGSLSHEKLMDLLWRTMNFIGLVIILVFFLKKPIGNSLSSRRQAIREKFEDLDAQKAGAEQLYKEYEAKLAKIDDEIKSIIEAAVKQGEVEKQRIIADAERAAGDIKRQSEMAIQYELSEAKYRLRSDIAEQAAAMAEQMIKKNLQEADQNKLVEDYLAKVGAIQ